MNGDNDIPGGRSADLSRDFLLQLEPFSEDIFRAYKEFNLDRARGGDRELSWTFDGGRGTPFSVARVDGHIVGMSAYIRSAIKLGNATGVAYQAVDSFVSAAARGKGMFTRLAAAFGDEAEAQGIDVIWGFPNANAAPAWFGKLGWRNHGQVPLLVKPLRAGYFLRKARLPFDFRIARHRNENIAPAVAIDDHLTEVWTRFSERIGCAVVRDRAHLTHRLFEAPHADAYRVVVDPGEDGALVAVRVAEKHGGRIGYLIEAMGGRSLPAMLSSELGWLTEQGAEIVLAWCFPWSPNYAAYRKAGFYSLPERFRPIEINFGSRAFSPQAALSDRRESWYLSYLDSDGI